MADQYYPIKEATLNQVFRGKAWHKIDGATFTDGSDRVHVRYNSTDPSGRATYKFSIYPRTLLENDWELWICGSADNYYLFPISVADEMYSHPDAYPDKRSPHVKIISVDSEKHQAMYAAGATSMDLAPYYRIDVDRQPIPKAKSAPVSQSSDQDEPGASQFCVYNTDPNWVVFLRENGIADRVNFWRKDKRQLHLQEGTFFYFKLTGSRDIVGRGKFSRAQLMSLSEAWNEFGQANGVATYADFADRAAAVISVEGEDPEINCIILKDLEFLKPDDYYSISEEAFPRSIMAHKFFEAGSLPGLERHFEKTRSSPPTPITPPGFQAEYTMEDFVADTGHDHQIVQRWLHLLKRKRQIIFQGPPGTGKTFVAERLAQLMVSESEGVTETVQFHPAYSYEDFVQGYRPELINGSMVLQLKPGRFLEFCTAARSVNSTEPNVLVIDEINRANLSQVFGELLYLLEYREREVDLATGGQTFSIPRNVYLIGTMNTADRSIALVDYALRRRFAFIRLQPAYNILRNHLVENLEEILVDSLVTTIREINVAIDDPNYELGISFFMRDGADLTSTLSEIWISEIEPYLEEFFFDRPEKAKAFTWSRLTRSQLKAWLGEGNIESEVESNAHDG